LGGGRVDNRQLRLGRTGQGEQFGAVSRLADDLKPRAVKQAGEAFAQQDIVVGEHDPRCTPTQRRCVGCPGR